MIYDINNCARNVEVINGRTNEDIPLVLSVDTDKLVLTQHTGKRAGDSYETVEHKLESVQVEENASGVPVRIIVFPAT